MNTDDSKCPFCGSRWTYDTGGGGVPLRWCDTCKDYRRNLLAAAEKARQNQTEETR